MKKVLIIIISAVFVQLGIAQNREFNNQNTIKEGVITGKITDANTKKPIEYANLVLYRVKDSSMVTGTISDINGVYTIADVPYGRFYLVANFIGYYKKTIDGIRITPENKTFSVSEIFLSQAVNQLEEVNIVAEKSYIEYKIDKKVVNVSQHLNATGGTAIDVLENIPSVKVDIDGNVSLRGSSSFTVLIDGKPSVLKGSEALQQIPSSSIENLEIITNPSAKYDPEGIGGIINVVTKKNSMNGISGIVNANIGNYGNFGGDFLINYRTKSFNIFGGANYNYHKMPGNNAVDRETRKTDTIEYYSGDVDRTMGHSGYNIKFGADYFISNNQTITVSANLGEMSRERSFFTKYHRFTFPESINLYSINDNSSKSERTFYSGNLNYLLKFNRKGHEVSVNIDYAQRNGDSPENQYILYTDSNWVADINNSEKRKASEKGDSYNFNAKLDYSLPLSENNKFESGLNSTNEYSKEDYLLEQYNSDSDNWTELALYSNNMDFVQNIHAAYSTLTGKLYDFEWKAGLRGEYTYRNIKDRSDENYTIDRIDLYPSAYVSRQLPWDLQIQASYNRRVNRPRGWFLDPFPSFVNEYTIRTGNPDLQPEFINSYELNLQKRLKNGAFISTELFHRQTVNMITRIVSVKDDGIMYINFQNMNKDYSTGVELMTNLNLSKWWKLNLTGTVFQYNIKGDIEGDDISVNSTNWDIRTNSTFIITPLTRIQLNASYQGPRVTAQGNEKSGIRTDIAIRQELFKKKLSLSFRMRDIFGTGKQETISEGANFYTKMVFEHQPRIFSIAISYKINNYKKTERREENGNMDMDTGM